jgi:hypothetical protein
MKQPLHERFQQLAGIRPLYEQESNRDKYIAKAKELLGTAKMGTEALIDKIKASPEFQKMEAEVKKELQTGKITKAGISKAANAIKVILTKIKDIASSAVSTEEKRKNLQSILKQLQILPMAGVIFGLLAKLAKFVSFGYLDQIPQVNISVALSIALGLMTARIMLGLYTVFGSSDTNEGLVENELISNDEEEIIQSLLQNPE